MRLPLALAVSVLIAVGALSNVACSPMLAPVFAPSSAAGLSPNGAPYSLAQIEQAIVQGAMSKGWTVVHRGPGVVIADVMAGGHGARVRVLFNESGWHITHEQSSPGLKFHVDERHGEVIHRRYNHWVHMLDDAIRQALVAPTAGGMVPAPAEPSVPAVQAAPAQPAT